VTQLNEKQEKFCQAYILHRNATRAATAAGYSETSAYNQGYRLLQEERVKERIEELTNEISTDVDVISEIEKQYEQARNAGHGAIALKALELLSRVRGNSSEDSDTTEETLEQEIVGTLQIIGFEKAFLLLEQAFPEQFWEEDNLDEDPELLFPEELSSTTDAEAGSDNDA
jgi:hypothetical protein